MKTIQRNTMKKSLFLIRAFVIALIITAFNQAWTNLDEELFSEVTPDNFFKNEEEFISALGAAYTAFGNWASSDGTLALQTVTTDEMAVPTRGSDWDDGGNWRRLHLHSWTLEDYQTNDGWTLDSMVLILQTNSFISFNRLLKAVRLSRQPLMPTLQN
jgi:hypothetical protein